jgi:hypothetical protein
MNILLRSLTALFAAVFAGGIFLVTPTGATAAPEERAVVAKRQDAVSELATVDDDDDDANRDQTNTNSNTRSKTGNSRSARDNTNSRVTKVSRDRDLSRRDLTKDRTRDGGDRTRNHTNDGSRHDTR